MAEQFDAVHFGHHHVGENEFHLAVLAQFAQRLLAVGCGDDVVFVVEAALQELARVEIVFHHQDGGLR